MSEPLLAGFLPLVDSAVLVAAHEKGFARDHGFELGLVKEPSWAILRDHLNLGLIDCAHALAPLPIAAALGIGQVQSDLVVPFVLGRGGNAITVSRALAESMRVAARPAVPATAQQWGDALARVVAERSEPLTLAMVYPFSGHNFEIRYWLAASGIHPDRDLKLVAVPPPLMVESLRAGQVDGFCVGAPWNSLAVEHGLGEVIVTKSELFPRGIEKVLAMRKPTMADGGLVRALLQALNAAALWCDAAANKEELAALLARPEYLGLPAGLISRALAGDVGARAPDPEFMYFASHDAGCPHLEEALWIFAQMRRWGQVRDDTRLQAVAASVFRPDVYREFVGGAQDVDRHRVETGDGIAFDGDVEAYLERFALSTPFGGLADPET